MLGMLVNAEQAEREVEVQKEWRLVVGHFPGEPHARADVAEQRQAVLQARVLVQCDEYLIMSTIRCGPRILPLNEHIPGWQPVAPRRRSERRPPSGADDRARPDRCSALCRLWRTECVALRPVCARAERGTPETPTV